MQLAMREFIRAYNQRHEATVLLTSHYMDDVVALCPRVIVIDGGVIIHDGDLRALVKTMHPDKLVSFTVTGPVGDDVLARLGAVVRREAGRVVLRVPESSLRDAVAHLLSALPVTDLSIEDPPLEDVMRTLFKDHRPAEPREAQGA
jgi:ABC-2 type transport system ATP-binding protein